MMERIGEKRTISTYVDPDLAQRVEELADDERRSMSSMLMTILQEYFELEPIRRVLKAREMNLLTHQEALERLSVLVERNGNGSEQ